MGDEPRWPNHVYEDRGGSCTVQSTNAMITSSPNWPRRNAMRRLAVAAPRSRGSRGQSACVQTNHPVSDWPPRRLPPGLVRILGGEPQYIKRSRNVPPVSTNTPQPSSLLRHATDESPRNLSKPNVFSPPHNDDIRRRLVVLPPQRRRRVCLRRRGQVQLRQELGRRVRLRELGGPRTRSREPLARAVRSTTVMQFERIRNADNTLQASAPPANAPAPDPPRRTNASEGTCACGKRPAGKSAL